MDTATATKYFALIINAFNDTNEIIKSHVWNTDNYKMPEFVQYLNDYPLTSNYTRQNILTISTMFKK